MEMVYKIKINIKGLKEILTIHDSDTQQRFDLQTGYCRTDIFKKSATNLGTKLYNKLPNHMKGLENLKLFKKELKAFYYITLFIQWTNTYHMGEIQILIT